MSDKKDTSLEDRRILGKIIAFQEKQIGRRLDYLDSHQVTDPKTSRKAGKVIAALMAIAVGVLAAGYWLTPSEGNALDKLVVVTLLASIAIVIAFQCLRRKN